MRIVMRRLTSPIDLTEKEIKKVIKGIKTIFFTIIGPLINSARARCHINGVYRPDLVRKVAEVWRMLDYRHILVVHGLDGLDEISLVGGKAKDLKEGVESLSLGFLYLSLKTKIFIRGGKGCIIRERRNLKSYPEKEILSLFTERF